MSSVDIEVIRQRLAIDDDDCYGNDRVALLALVDLQTRALLAVEWGNPDEHIPGNGVCTMCHGVQWPDNENHGHDAACPLDAALTACGLDTAEKRDAARKAMR